MGAKVRALNTVWKKAKYIPGDNWKMELLESRHSPTRYLRFSFRLEGIPTKVSNHLVRHKYIEPYVSSNRTDRQSVLTDEEVNRLTPVNVICDMNAEELMVVANKRLCNCAEKDTRDTVKAMCDEVIKVCPEFELFLVPICVYHGGTCHEMKSCGRFPHRKEVAFLYE